MLLVKAQRGLIVYRDFQYYMIAAGLLELLLGAGKQERTQSVVLAFRYNVNSDNATHKARTAPPVQAMGNNESQNRPRLFRYQSGGGRQMEVKAHLVLVISNALDETGTIDLQQPIEVSGPVVA